MSFARALPNVISLSRLVLAAAFVVVHESTPRVAIIVVASLSDFLDGFLARRAGLSSRWGALVDPIADRIFVLTVVAVYVWRGELTPGEYYTLISRDIATAVGFLVARAIPWLRTVKFTARPLGKVVTALQLLVLLAVPLAPGWVAPLVVAVGVVSALAIADYTIALWRARARA